MILLQNTFQIIQGSDNPPNFFIFLGIAAGVIVILLVVGSIVNRRRAPRTPREQAQYSRFVFNRTAKAMGLPSVHADTLQTLVLACKVKQPFLVFSSTGFLTTCCARASTP